MPDVQAAPLRAPRSLADPSGATDDGEFDERRPPSHAVPEADDVPAKIEVVDAFERGGHATAASPEIS